MADALVFHRLQFAFTIIYHYLFPQLTMGLALLIVFMKALGLRQGGERWNDAARFWIRIFGINFAVGVVTGIPMEFQFGTNWANFSRLAGPVIGHTLGMEGLFAFFLESSFLASLVWGEKRLGRTGHFLAAIALFLGSWLSGYFIVATNAFMQHPAGHRALPDGSLRLADFRAFVLNPWALAQYAHNMAASVVTASFVVAAAGAHYALSGRHLDHARRFLALGTRAGVIAVAVALDLRQRLERSRAALWVLMLSFPFPYIATTAGWMTAELGRQPWLVYGLLRTALGASPTVHSGTALFTLIGFCGLYFVLGLLFLFLVFETVRHGPPAGSEPTKAAARHGY